jgi:hypothetical protein
MLKPRIKQKFLTMPIQEQLDFGSGCPIGLENDDIGKIENLSLECRLFSRDKLSL